MSRTWTVSARLFVALAANFALAFQAAALSVTYKDESPDPITAGAYDGAEDTTLIERSNDPRNQNFGGRSNMFVHNNGGDRENILVRFDVTSLAGQYASIDGATLRLFFWDNPSGPGGPGAVAGFIDAFELTAANGDWVEGAGESSVITNVFPGTSTWAEKLRGTQSSNGTPSGTPWASGAHNYGIRNGGAGLAPDDHASAAVASAEVFGTEVSFQALDFVISDLSLIDDWANGSNTGLVLISRAAVGQTGGGGTFYSSEGDTANALHQAFHPELIIDYTPVPEPGAALLVLEGLLLAACLQGRARPPHTAAKRD